VATIGISIYHKKQSILQYRILVVVPPRCAVVVYV